MEAIHVDVRRAATPDLETDLQTARIVAQAMDAQFEIAGIRFGLDAILGLIPVAGDVASLAIGVYPIYLAKKHGLPRHVILRMWGNLALDFVGGLVPIVGDAADVFIRANLKNVELLEKAARRKYAMK